VLTMTAVVLILLWIVALFFSFTLNGWIHLFPAVAALLLFGRWWKKPAPQSDDYLEWKQAHARRPDR
jgi:membrane associated rhomboid family serine protease